MAQLGAAHAFSLNGALMELVSGAYYATRVNLQSCRIRINGDWTEIKNQAGEVSSIIATGDALEATFDVIPEGTTWALAFGGAKLPPRLTGFNATGFGKDQKTPTAVLNRVPIGPFLIDGFNNDLTDTQPWYFKEGEVSASNSGHWTGQWTMVRFVNVTGTLIAA